MSGFLAKLKSNWKKTAKLSSLFLVTFLILFYLANLDFKPLNNTSASSDNSISLNTVQKIDSILKDKVGSIEISFSSYDEWAKQKGLDSNNKNYDGDPDSDGLPNYLEYVYGADPKNPDTDGDSFSDKQEIVNGYDPDAKGDARPIVEVSIDKIGVGAPMVWSNDPEEKKLLADLQNGVSHYPKTASPGQNGNMIISGHSSNFVWAKGDYNHIFKNLNDLEAGDVVKIKNIQQNGRVIVYTYKITEKKITTADDQATFEQTDQPTLTLSTCWPIGTNLKRLIVKAEIVK